MLKLRVMPTLLYKDLTLVKGVGFDSWRRVGSLLQAIKVYNMREVDELVFMDIAATKAGRRPDFQLVDDFADECFMPLTVGGGVATVEDIQRLLQVGADKVAINTAAVRNPHLITEGATRFGSQCIVVSIDCRRNGDGNHEVFTHSGTKRTGLHPVQFAKTVEALGAGEILLTSIDRDGTMTGYDIEITKAIASVVNIPVIASGGAGNYEHMASVVKDANVAAVAAASIFHFTQQTPLEAKLYLKDHGVRVRT
ncbi:MAG: glycosyl amidation-associated protein WbuZ [Proteobacteria bacterium]|nr:glycosyl amidation-associated protein WbuZ [Pseudomonadota bacterium]